jgi:hypothetical protein
MDHFDSCCPQELHNCNRCKIMKQLNGLTRSVATSLAAAFADLSLKVFLDMNRQLNMIVSQVETFPHDDQQRREQLVQTAQDEVPVLLGELKVGEAHSSAHRKNHDIPEAKEKQLLPHSCNSNGSVVTPVTAASKRSKPQEQPQALLLKRQKSTALLRCKRLLATRQLRQQLRRRNEQIQQQITPTNQQEDGLIPVPTPGAGVAQVDAVVTAELAQGTMSSMGPDLEELAGVAMDDTLFSDKCSMEGNADSSDQRINTDTDNSDEADHRYSAVNDGNETIAYNNFSEQLIADAHLWNGSPTYSFLNHMEQQNIGVDPSSKFGLGLMAEAPQPVNAEFVQPWNPENQEIYSYYIIDNGDLNTNESSVAAGHESYELLYEHEQPAAQASVARLVAAGGIKKRRKKQNKSNKALQAKEAVTAVTVTAKEPPAIRELKKAGRRLKRQESSLYVLQVKDGKFPCSRCFKPFSTWYNAVNHYRDIHLGRKVLTEPWRCTFEKMSDENDCYVECKTICRSEKTKESHLRINHGKRECRFCKSIFDLTPVNGGMSESERHETEIHGKPPLRKPRKKSSD